MTALVSALAVAPAWAWQEAAPVPSVVSGARTPAPRAGVAVRPTKAKLARAANVTTARKRAKVAPARARNAAQPDVQPLAPIQELRIPQLQEAPAPAAPAQPAKVAPAPAPPAQPAKAAPAPASPVPPVSPAPTQSPLAGPGTVTPRVVSLAMQNRNLRFDITITDTGGAKPVTKSMSLTVSSGNNAGSIRNNARMPGGEPMTVVSTEAGKPPTSINQMMNFPLNVDVRAVNWVDDNAVRANVSVEYQPYVPDAKSQPGVIVASATTLFYDGRKTQILQASDPVSDRRTTIEVTATILK